MGQLKISIVTVAYNSANTLREIIQSVLCQSYPNIEYIIIDGASKDGTVNLIKEYEPLFGERMQWTSEADSGLYEAMDKGFRRATGDVIGIINSDDQFIDSLAIEKVMRCFSIDKRVDGVYADLYYVAQKDDTKVVRYWITGKQRAFNKGWHPAHPTFYVKREFYDMYGAFDLSYKIAADFEWMLRLIEKGNIKVVYLPEILVKMRLGGISGRNLGNRIKSNIECYSAFKKNGVQVNLLYPLYRLLPKLLQYFRCMRF